jgi:hypothetical protein
MKEYEAKHGSLQRFEDKGSDEMIVEDTAENEIDNTDHVENIEWPEEKVIKWLKMVHKAPLGKFVLARLQTGKYIATVNQVVNEWINDSDSKPPIEW